jgi:hypothetical protein
MHPDAANNVAEYTFINMVGRAILHGLTLRGGRIGSAINAKKALAFFGDGYADHLLYDLLSEGVDAALLKCDPNSMEWVPNLDFEIGLDIAETGVSKDDALRGSISRLMSQYYESDRYGAPSGMSEALRAFGIDPWLYHGRYKENPDEFSLFMGKLLLSMPLSGGSDFRYAYPDRVKDNECDPLRGTHEWQGLIFRPAMRGFNMWSHSAYFGFRFRLKGVVMFTPFHPPFIELDESSRFSWERRVTEVMRKDMTVLSYLDDT